MREIEPRLVSQDERVDEFSAFYRDNYSLILTTVRRRLNDSATAEDVTSEVFRIAWQHHEAGNDLTLPWLYTVARNVVGNEYRRTGRATASTRKVELHVSGQILGADENKNDVRNALAMLRESDREILFMAYWEDLSGTEIGTILGCSTNTVWMRLSRARSAFKKQMTPSESKKPLKRSGSEVQTHG